MTKNKTIEIDCPYVYWPLKYVLLLKCQFKIFCWALCVFLIVFKEFLVLDISVLLLKCTAVMFCHCGLPWYFLMMSFNENKFLLLMPFIQSALSYMISALCILKQRLKNLCLSKVIRIICIYLLNILLFLHSHLYLWSTWNWFFVYR